MAAEMVIGPDEPGSAAGTAHLVHPLPPEALKALMVEAVREVAESSMRDIIRDEFFNVGMNARTDDHVETLREDFKFLRRLRKAVDSASGAVGKAILVGLAGALLAIVLGKGAGKL